MAERSNRQVAEAVWEAMERQDLDTVESLMAPDCVQEWPQSGEVIRGRDNIMAINRNYPGFPTIKGREIRGEGNVWVGEAELDYHGRRVQLCSIWELRDGLIVRETDYFADPFDAPKWRERWVDRKDDRPPPPPTGRW